jgi:hypothetical protein
MLAKFHSAFPLTRTLSHQRRVKYEFLPQRGERKGGKIPPSLPLQREGKNKYIIPPLLPQKMSYIIKFEAKGLGTAGFPFSWE